MLFAFNDQLHNEGYDFKFISCTGFCFALFRYINTVLYFQLLVPRKWLWLDRCIEILRDMNGDNTVCGNIYISTTPPHGLWWNKIINTLVAVSAVFNHGSKLTSSRTRPFSHAQPPVCKSSSRTALRRPSLQTQVQRKPENTQNRKIPTQILFKRKMRAFRDQEIRLGCPRHAIHDH